MMKNIHDMTRKEVESALIECQRMAPGKVVNLTVNINDGRGDINFEGIPLVSAEILSFFFLLEDENDKFTFSIVDENGNTLDGYIPGEGLQGEDYNRYFDYILFATEKLQELKSL